MGWVWLSLAGVLEVIWAIGLKQLSGFDRPLILTLTLAAIVASYACLVMAMQSLPLGTAYAVWVGIGAVGAASAGVLLFGESLSLLKLASLALIVVGVVGLKLAG